MNIIPSSHINVHAITHYLEMIRHMQISCLELVMENFQYTSTIKQLNYMSEFLDKFIYW